jgi:hypothetical protein
MSLCGRWAAILPAQLSSLRHTRRCVWVRGSRPFGKLGQALRKVHEGRGATVSVMAERSDA